MNKIKSFSKLIIISLLIIATGTLSVNINKINMQKKIRTDLNQMLEQRSQEYDYGKIQEDKNGFQIGSLDKYNIELLSYYDLSGKKVIEIIGTSVDLIAFFNEEIAGGYYSSFSYEISPAESEKYLFIFKGNEEKF